MFSKVISSAVLGVDGTVIGVEADVNDGLPSFTMVGYLSSSVKEAGERVRTALKNSGYHMPPKRITINLSPADMRKDGSGFDLPIAVSILLSLGIMPVFDMEKTLVIGELSLNGEVKPVTGILPMVYHCYNQGISRCIVPKNNINEASLVKNMEVIGVCSLEDAMDIIQGIKKPEVLINKKEFEDTEKNIYNSDFSDIKGQEMLKRGMEIAAAGFHNVLMTGAAGAGKSMLAKCLPSIMPTLSFEESIEVTKIYSISGLLGESTSLIRNRPFRSPHHTISNHALCGGGANPKPGEVSLAHNGVLFLDELPEFNKNVLEVMRQPLEDRKITISRVNASYVFPADFMLVAAMNPCPCGNFPDMKKCTCSPSLVRRYQSRISGPLLDRIDINMEVKPIKYEELFNYSSGEDSKSIRKRVEKAADIQKSRYKEEGIQFNSQLDGSLLKKYIFLDYQVETLLENAFKRMNLSARGTYRILKLARTIADLEGKTEIEKTHIEEAIFYRNSGQYSAKEVF
ncbi:MAG: ATP-binding protein [Lachnospiraceae bacterium]|nr:ATP-binding protein [Lachnospiraceae bacterium]